MLMIKNVSALLVIIALSFSCKEKNDIASYLDKLHQDGALNGNVLVIKSGSRIFESSYGYADATKEQVLSSDYRFGIGSIYKEFPAVGIMQLLEKGALEINDPLSKYLTGLPDWSNEITIEHLLQYSSGLPQVPWGEVFQNGEVNESNVLKGLEKLESLASAPGEGYIYSNYNPFLLMRIIEKSTGLTFKEYLQQYLLEPFNLDGIVIHEHFPYHNAELMALPFDDEFQEDEVVHSLTSICSSVNGMYQWLSQLDGLKIISESSMKRISMTYQDSKDYQSPLGDCRWIDRTMRIHQHHGASGNYECLVSHYPEDDLMVILMTNQKHGNLDRITQKIVQMSKADL